MSLNQNEWLAVILESASFRTGEMFEDKAGVSRKGFSGRSERTDHTSRKALEETDKKATAASRKRDAAVGVSTRKRIRAWVEAQAELAPLAQPWVDLLAALSVRPWELPSVVPWGLAQTSWAARWAVAEPGAVLIWVSARFEVSAPAVQAWVAHAELVPPSVAEQAWVARAE